MSGGLISVGRGPNMLWECRSSKIEWSWKRVMSNVVTGKKRGGMDFLHYGVLIDLQATMNEMFDE